MTNTKVKLTFTLRKNDDGYPPDDFETVWAEPVGVNLYRVDNIPFYLQDVSPDDVVIARPSPPIPLLASEVARKSKNSVIQVIFFERGSDMEKILDGLVKMGAKYEGSHLKSLYSIEIPAELSFELIESLLDAAESQGILEYQIASCRHI